MGGKTTAAAKGKRPPAGFTLIELIVVIAILGVLTAIAVPSIVNYLSSSKEESYKLEQERFQTAVDAFFSAPGNSRFLGKRQYPLIGRGQTDQSSLNVETEIITLLDNGDPFNPQDHDANEQTDEVELWNPVGGTEGVELTSAWTDDDDGERQVANDSPDTWTSVTVQRGNVSYQTDPRYFFIDFEALISQGLLGRVPESAARDNAPENSTKTYTGNYIWYVDSNGLVQSLDRHLPSRDGFQRGVFP